MGLYMNSPAINLSQLRQQIRTTRRQLPAEQRDRANENIGQYVQKLLQHYKPATIGIYLPFDGEPDLRPLAGWFRQQQIALALPVINPAEYGVMQFYAWPTEASLLPNRFGIEEPQGTAALHGKIDLVLAPLVAFSNDGTRIGMGSGYYDRWLATQSARPVLVGIAYELQRVESLPKMHWDIPMNMVITEKGQFSFSE